MEGFEWVAELKDGMSAPAKEMTKAMKAMRRSMTDSKDAGRRLKDEIGKVGDMAKEAVKQMADFGMELLQSANEGLKQQNALQGLFTTLDDGTHSTEQLRAAAGEYSEELKKIGYASGVTSAETNKLFTSILMRGRMSADAAKDLTQQIVTAGRLIPGGADALGEGFANLEGGVVRARNPIVQLIASTGVLKGNAKEVADQLKKMSSGAQIEAAQKALALASSHGGPALNLDETLTSLKGLKEAFTESIGGPLLAHVLPALNSLREYLIANAGAIKDFASGAGRWIANIVDVAREAFGGIYEAVYENWGIINEAFTDMGDTFKDVIGVFSDTTETTHMKFKDMAEIVIYSFKIAAGYLKGAAEVMNDASDLFSKRKVGTTNYLAHGKELEALAKGTGPHAMAAFDNEARKVTDLARGLGVKDEANDPWITYQRKQLESRLKSDEDFADRIKHGKSEDVKGYIEGVVREGNPESIAYAKKVVEEELNSQKAAIKARESKSHHAMHAGGFSGGGGSGAGGGKGGGGGAPAAATARGSVRVDVGGIHIQGVPGAAEIAPMLESAIGDVFERFALELGQ